MLSLLMLFVLVVLSELGETPVRDVVSVALFGRQVNKSCGWPHLPTGYASLRHNREQEREWVIGALFMVGKLHRWLLV